MRYIKTEIDYVDFMLDRQSAELYILLIDQRTGSGGTEFIMTVENKKSSKDPYEIKFFTDANAVDADIRSEILKNIKNALLKHLVEEGLWDNITYTVSSFDKNSAEETVVDDSWNAWVFSLGMNGNINKESQFESQYFNLNVSANRVTDTHKFLSRISYNRNKSTFYLDDGEEEEAITNLQTSFWGRLLYAYSISDHWSLGGIARYNNSIFNNYDHSITLAPVIEYNIFPYDETADHNFTFRYELGARYNDYIDTTSYFESSELLARHRLSIDYQIVHSWGNIDIDAGASQFISRPDRYSIDINPSLNVNLFKGFNLYTGISYEITKDRINIPKGDLSVEDILLQNKLRDSDFSVRVYFGINYRFGSASNNVVNTRF